MDRLGDRATPGADREHMGDWILRSDLGVTRRANSCWVHGDPGGDPAAAVERVIEWYGSRGRPPIFQLYDGQDLPELIQILESRGLGAGGHSQVMVADTPRFHSEGANGLTIAEAPHAAFHSLFGEPERITECSRTTLPQRFVSVEQGGQLAGAGMVAVDGPWAGLFLLQTDPLLRRQGIGSAAAAALVAQGRSLGAQRFWLQVGCDNVGAIAMYERAGFATVRRYCYYSRG